MIKKLHGREPPLNVFIQEEDSEDISLTGLEKTDLKEIEFYYHILVEVKTTDKELKAK